MESRRSREAFSLGLLELQDFPRLCRPRIRLAGTVRSGNTGWNDGVIRRKPHRAWSTCQNLVNLHQGLWPSRLPGRTCRVVWANPPHWAVGGERVYAARTWATLAQHSAQRPACTLLLVPSLNQGRESSAVLVSPLHDTFPVRRPASMESPNPGRRHHNCGPNEAANLLSRPLARATCEESAWSKPCLTDRTSKGEGQERSTTRLETARHTQEKTSEATHRYATDDDNERCQCRTVFASMTWRLYKATGRNSVSAHLRFPGSKA